MEKTPLFLYPAGYFSTESTTLSDDYFDFPTKAELNAQSASLFNSFRIMEPVSPKRPAITGLDPGLDPCPKNLGLYIYNPATGRSMTLPCRSRLCPACGKGWAKNWQKKLGWNEFFHKDDKALTITSACDPGYKAFWLALKAFWRNVRNYCHIRPEFLDPATGEYRPKLYYKVSPSGVRKWLPLREKKLKHVVKGKLIPYGENFRIIRPFRKIEYFGVVEYNQLHTQPHFHFVLRSGYIPQKIVQKCWQRAQTQANFPVIAFDVRIEKIESGVKAYFTKYITKLIEGKDELPRPENWQGRGVRYSRDFFAARSPLMQAAIRLENAQFKDDYTKYYALHSKKTPMLEQKLDIDYQYASEIEVINGAWQPDADIKRAGMPVLFEVVFKPHIPGSQGDIFQNFSFEPWLSDNKTITSQEESAKFTLDEIFTME